MKKIKCNVCKYRFSLNKAMVKKVYEPNNLFDNLSGKQIKIYNATDCPNCGCQIILSPRLKEVKEKIKNEEKEIQNNQKQ